MFIQIRHHLCLRNLDNEELENNGYISTDAALQRLICYWDVDRVTFSHLISLKILFYRNNYLSLKISSSSSWNPCRLCDETDITTPSAFGASLVLHAKCKILAGPAFGQDFLEMGNTHFWEEKFHLRDRERTIREGRYCTVSFNIKVSIDSKPHKGIKIYYFSFPKHRQFEIFDSHQNLTRYFNFLRYITVKKWCPWNECRWQTRLPAVWSPLK